uniref:S-adenosylmethionine decarboxylase proenzyme n=1 Tax=Syphacia muris TaxID=451379 RepID=A0A0N5AUR1_9BILA
MSLSSASNASCEELISSDESSNFSSLSKEDQYFFEGAEKLLEIWFDKTECDAQSLRLIPFDELVCMLDIAQCHILHSASNEFVDSYVLSESSMFVFDEHIILKTCGSTRLLYVLDYLFHLARKYANMNVVIGVFYSHKNFMRPDRQPELHQKFPLEMNYLDRYFENGSSYCLGSLKQDCWFLYTMSLPQLETYRPEHTLEILMTEMSSDVLSVFSRKVCKDGKECTKKSGIDRIVPYGTIMHEELFDPCGYSMNGLLPNTDQYVTIHVTPESGFSYASFETNQNLCSLYQQTLKVIEVFKPSKFLLTVFSNDFSAKGKETQQSLWECPISGYRRANVQLLKLEFETLVYAQYVRS